MIEPV